MLDIQLGQFRVRILQILREPLDVFPVWLQLRWQLVKFVVIVLSCPGILLFMVAEVVPNAFPLLK